MKLLLLLIAASAAFGQPAGLPTFQAASVKPTPPGQNRLRRDHCGPGGRFTVSGTPVMWSLTYAFRLEDYQIEGAPV